MAVNSTGVDDTDVDPADRADAGQQEGPLMVRQGGWNMAAKWFVFAMILIGLLLVLMWVGEFGF